MQSKGNLADSNSTILGQLKATPLDKLAHEVTSPSEKEGSKHYNSLSKRQLAKAITVAKTKHLQLLDSPLKKAYSNTLKCNEYLHQNGQNLVSERCKNRWCLVCARIRAMHLMHAYLPVLEPLKKELYHVVLTRGKTVSKLNLVAAIKDMNLAFRRIVRNAKKTYGMDVVAIRNTECTYRDRSGLFHPHFHLLIHTEDAAKYVIDSWLKQFPNASRKSQKSGIADVNKLIELFKYTAKGIIKNKHHAVAEDAIYRAFRNKKTLVTFNLKKMKIKNDSIIHSKIDWKGDGQQVWKWDQSLMDWVAPDGELLMSRHFTGVEMELIDKLK